MDCVIRSPLFVPLALIPLVAMLSGLGCLAPVLAPAEGLSLAPPWEETAESAQLRELVGREVRLLLRPKSKLKKLWLKAS